MKIIIIVVAVIAAIIAIVLIIGASLPKNHSVSRSATFKKDPRTVYAAVRAGVNKVEWLDDKHFREHSKRGVVTYEVVEDDPGRKFVTRITDQNLGYSGSWTHDFEQVPGGTRLTMTENGEVTNVFFRFMSRFVFGHTATIDAYLKSMQRHLA